MKINLTELTGYLILFDKQFKQVNDLEENSCYEYLQVLFNSDETVQKQLKQIYLELSYLRWERYDTYSNLFKTYDSVKILEIFMFNTMIRLIGEGQDAIDIVNNLADSLFDDE